MHHRAGPFVFATLVALSTAACTATGSSTVVGIPAGSSGSSGETVTQEPAGDGGAGISEPTDYAALFGPPSSTDATANSLDGLWAGQGNQGQDMRIKFSASSIILAVKCSTVTVGMKVTARVSSSAIKILESKTESDLQSKGCRISVMPAERAACTPDGFESNCFALKGTQLELNGFLGTGLGAFTKLSD